MGVQSIAQKQKTAGYARAKHDFYVEPEWAVRVFALHEEFVGAIHDPACGTGTIPRVFSALGYEVSGADLVMRDTPWQDAQQEFLATTPSTPWQNIVCNPPYSLAERFLEHALIHTLRKVAFIVRLDFLASQRRAKIYHGYPLSRVWVMSRRPSMPPGDGDTSGKGGMHDYCWVVFDHEYDGEAKVGFLL